MDVGSEFKIVWWESNTFSGSREDGDIKMCEIITTNHVGRTGKV